MVSFPFNEAQPGLEASSDLGIRSYKGSGFLGQTLPSRVRGNILYQTFSSHVKWGYRGQTYLIIPVLSHHQGKTWPLFRGRNGRQ